MSYCGQALLLRACYHRGAPVLALRPVLASRRLSTTATPPSGGATTAGASAAGAAVGETAAVGGKESAPELAAAAKKRREDKCVGWWARVPEVPFACLRSIVEGHHLAGYSPHSGNSFWHPYLPAVPHLVTATLAHMMVLMPPPVGSVLC